jgi:hypothetical protein
VFRCNLCCAVFENRRHLHYSGIDDERCPGILEICELDFDELVLSRIARKRTRSKRDRAKLAVKRKKASPPKAAQCCPECESRGDLCPKCEQKKMKRDWARAKRARLKSERQHVATRIAGLFGAPSSLKS